MTLYIVQLHELCKRQSLLLVYFVEVSYVIILRSLDVNCFFEFRLMISLSSIAADFLN